jgi:small-conductance mechanosensitive channel
LFVRYKQSSVFFSIVLILLTSSFAGASPRPGKKITAASAPTRWLTGVLNSGAESLNKKAKEAADGTAQVVADKAGTIAQLEDLKRRMAVLKTGMEVASLPAPVIGEILSKYSASELDLSNQLGGLKVQIQDVEQRRAKQIASLASIDKQVQILKGLNQPGVWTSDIQSAYDKYTAASAAFSDASGGLVTALGEKASLLKQQKDLLEGVLPQLKTLRQSALSEMLRCGGSKPLGEQLYELLCRMRTMPGQAFTGGAGVLNSGRIKLFLINSWAPIIGLLLFMVFLGWVARYLKRRFEILIEYLRPHFKETGVRILVRVACGVVSMTYPLAFLLWMAAACAALGLLTVVPALIVLYIFAGLVVLVITRRVIKDIFCGSETKKGCIPYIVPEAAPVLCGRLRAFAAYVVIGFVFIQILGLDKFPITLALLVNQIYGIGVLLWTCLLLRPGYLKTIIDRPVPARWTKWLSFSWAAFLFLLICVCLMALLGFQSFSIFAISAAVMTEVLLAGALLLAVVGKGVLKEIFEREHAVLGVLDAFDIQLRQLYFPARLALSTVLTVGFAACLLLVWGLGSASLMRFVDRLSEGIDLGSLHLSPLTVFAAAFVLYVGFRGSGLFRTVLHRRVLPRTGWDLGVQYSIATILHYTIIIIGVLLAMNILGFPLGSLALLAGAMGIGAGLGLQNVIANFVSGLVLLFERPVKVGDTLIVDGQWGEVKAIKMRSTVFQTFERSVLIIPNSDLLSGKIVNWSHYGGAPNRLTLRVGVSYSSDVKVVTRLLQQICAANPRVLKDPAPQTFFEAYGDSSLDFSIRVFVREASERVPATHEINMAIFEAFQENGIEIPFPQRDLHIIDDRKAPCSEVEEPRPVGVRSAS